MNNKRNFNKSDSSAKHFDVDYFFHVLFFVVIQEAVGVFKKHAISNSKDRDIAFSFAKESLDKINNVEDLIKLQVEVGKWPQAQALAKQHPEFGHAYFLPYAEWLVRQDRYTEAVEAYHMANSPKSAVSLLEQLACNAILEVH